MCACVRLQLQVIAYRSLQTSVEKLNSGYQGFMIAYDSLCWGEI